MTGVSGIVLAGGRSSRFGADKLARPIDGRPLLHHAVRALDAICRELLVVIAPGIAAPSLPDGLALSVRFVRDPEPYGGPLVGLHAGLSVAVEPLVLVVGGDQPTLRRELLEMLVGVLEGTTADAVALRDEALVRPLPLAVRRVPALAAAETVLATGVRSLRGLYGHLAVAIIDEPAWRAVDPEGEWRLDVDRPEDLS